MIPKRKPRTGEVPGGEEWESGKKYGTKVKEAEEMKTILTPLTFLWDKNTKKVVRGSPWTMGGGLPDMDPYAGVEKETHKKGGVQKR